MLDHEIGRFDQNPPLPSFHDLFFLTPSRRGLWKSLWKTPPAVQRMRVTPLSRSRGPYAILRQSNQRDARYPRHWPRTSGRGFLDHAPNPADMQLLLLANHHARALTDRPNPAPGDLVRRFMPGLLDRAHGDRCVPIALVALADGHRRSARGARSPRSTWRAMESDRWRLLPRGHRARAPTSTEHAAYHDLAEAREHLAARHELPGAPRRRLEVRGVDAERTNPARAMPSRDLPRSTAPR